MSNVTYTPEELLNGLKEMEESGRLPLDMGLTQALKDTNYISKRGSDIHTKWWWTLKAHTLWKDLKAKT